MAGPASETQNGFGFKAHAPGPKVPQILVVLFPASEWQDGMDINEPFPRLKMRLPASLRGAHHTTNKSSITVHLPERQIPSSLEPRGLVCATLDARYFNLLRKASAVRAP